MKLHTFNDGTAIIVGADHAQIVSDRNGKLQIGTASFDLAANVPFAVPALYDGLKAVKLVGEGKVYNAGQVNVRHSRLVSQSYMSRNEIELKHRCDALEDTVAALSEKVKDLTERFDTNALNMLI